MADELLRALGAQQRKVPPQVDPADGTAMERPFDDQERGSILDAVFEQIDTGGRVEELTVPVSAEPVDLGARRSLARIVAVVAVVAAAAAVLLFVRVPTLPTQSQLPTLPTYSISVRGGVASMRGAPGEMAEGPVVLRPDAEFNCVLTPLQPVGFPLALAIIAVPRDGDGDARLLRPPQAVFSPVGAMRLRGPVSEVLGLPAGAWTLEFVVAPAQAMPTDVAEARAEGFAHKTLQITITAQ